MRHLKRNKKLGRKGDHRNAMLANLVASLIEHKSVRTTLARAKAARPVAEKLVTLGKRAHAAAKAASESSDDKARLAAQAENVHCRRLAAARLRQHSRSLFPGSRANPGKVRREKWVGAHDVVRILCDQIAPVFQARAGGYTRILRLGARRGDSGEMAILEWVERPVDAAAETAADAEAKADGKA